MCVVVTCGWPEAAGYTILCSDTAGLRDSDDPIEREGVRRALKRFVSWGTARCCIAFDSLHHCRRYPQIGNNAFMNCILLLLVFLPVLYTHNYSCRAEDADLKILIIDSSLLMDMMNLHQTTPSLPSMASQFLAQRDGSMLQHNCCNETTGIFRPDDTIVVLNKTDLMREREQFGLQRELLQTRCEGTEVCAMSCKTGEGVDVFMGHLEKMLRTM